MTETRKQEHDRRDQERIEREELDIAAFQRESYEALLADNGRLREVLKELRQALHLVDQDLRCLSSVAVDTHDVWVSLQDAQAIVERAIES